MPAVCYSFYFILPFDSQFATFKFSEYRIHTYVLQVTFLIIAKGNIIANVMASKGLVLRRNRTCR